MMSKNKRTTRRDYLPPDKYLTGEQIARLLQTVRAEANRARRRGSARGLVNEMLIELMLESGLRSEEVCHLQLRDLPTHHGKDIVLVRRGKGDVLRTVVVKMSLKQKLQSFIKRCRRSAKPGSPLFVNESGYRLLNARSWKKGKVAIRREMTARMSYPTLFNKIKRIGKRAGLPNLSPHMLRHSFASHLYAVKQDLRFVQQQLGHSRPEITARYAKVFDEERRRQIEQLYDDNV